MTRITVLIVMIVLGAGPLAQAADVEVSVKNLRSEEGTVRVAICTEDTFTKPACTLRGNAPASEGAVVVKDVPAGRYAVQAYHDENDDRKINRFFFKLKEGIGFSNDAKMRRGPPKFADAAIQIEDDTSLELTIIYY